jgi:hypothetical protein
MDRVHAAPLEHRVGLGVFFTEWIAGDAVMSKKLFQLHPWQDLS